MQSSIDDLLLYCRKRKDVEALLKDEPAVLALWWETTTGEPGAHHDNIIRTAKQGTSLAYTLARLKRERPDLFERVTRRELSANAAALEAGFRKKPTPFEVISKLLPKLTAGEQAAVLRWLNERRVSSEPKDISKEIPSIQSGPVA